MPVIHTYASCPISAEQQGVLGIDPARVYVKYGTSADFGWNGSNF